MKRLLALLLCLSLLLPAFAFAEEEEEDVDFTELIEEDVDLDDEGNFVASGDEGEEDDFSDMESLAEAFDLDESVDTSELELNTNLPDDVINILLLGLDVKGTKEEKLRQARRCSDDPVHQHNRRIHQADFHRAEHPGGYSGPHE